MIVDRLHQLRLQNIENLKVSSLHTVGREQRTSLKRNQTENGSRVTHLKVEVAFEGKTLAFR